MKILTRFLSVALLLVLIGGCAVPPVSPLSTSAADIAERRIFDPRIDGKWIGNGISYGAWRDGEGPDQGSLTSKAHILEDLQILSTRWQLIRMYGADQQSRNILEVIEQHQLPFRVMQGAWLSSHKSAAQNEAQVEAVIELANRFPEIVVAVNVGNEIFVDWSWHRIEDTETVIGYIRDVRARIRQPVTVADDYNFWNKPQAAQIVAEVDFIGLHAYAFWNNKTLDVALDWTASIYRDIQQRYPQLVVALCESGWPTSRITGSDSYEGGLIGKAGEQQQKIFFDQYHEWIENNRIISYYFQAFDEQWKGGFDGEKPMAKAEKHWGLYRSDRNPKQVLR